MATPVWQPSTFYSPGSLVQPATAQPAIPAPIPNWSFESGNVEWILEAGLSITSSGDHFGPGTWSLQGDVGFLGNKFAEMQDFEPCVPGETITAKIQVQQGASSAGFTSGSVYLRFYDSGNVLITESEGNIVNDGSGGAWHQSSVTASAPALTAFVRIAIRMNRFGQNNPFWVDSVEWDKISQAQAGLIFKAVQTNIGLSGSVEPTWPLVNGVQVVDNEVTWEAILATRIVWEAHPILVSGSVEPAFVPVEGSTIGDNTISWRAISRRVTDPNCPNSKIVIIGASKVFAADDDIVPYCATVNPLDWSTANDAGYLPCNLQQYGANPVAGMGLYRSNLWVGNSQGSQMWQIDEDPANMALLDAFPVGTAHHDAISPAFNDLFFLPALGVRTIGIAGGSTNLQAGDVGMPVDPLVQEVLDGSVANGIEPFGLYYPAAGQYWLGFSDWPPPALSLFGDLIDGDVGDVGSYAYTAAGGFQPYTFDIASGSLPPGAVLGADGVVDFDYDAAGMFSWVVRVTDAQGQIATLPDSNRIFADGPWFYGPVAEDGPGGGSQAFYKTASNPLNWSGDPIPLPDGMDFLGRISAANGAVFFHGGSALTMARVSFDAGATWSACNIRLDVNCDVYWNGAFYYNGANMSADGITWAAIPGLLATPVGGTAFARDSDGAVFVAYPAGTIGISLDNGATWEVKTLPFSAPISGLESDGTRICGSMPTGIGFGYTDDMFTTVTNVIGNGFNGYTDFSDGVWLGRANGFVRRSLTLTAGSFTNVLTGQGEVGSFSKVIGHSPTHWASLQRLDVGQYIVQASDDGGITWDASPDTLYGNGENIAYPSRS